MGSFLCMIFFFFLFVSFNSLSRNSFFQTLSDVAFKKLLVQSPALPLLLSSIICSLSLSLSLSPRNLGRHCLLFLSFVAWRLELPISSCEWVEVCQVGILVLAIPWPLLSRKKKKITCLGHGWIFGEPDLLAIGSHGYF